MDPSDLQKLFLRKLGVRIGPEMSRYVLHQLLNGEAAPTGVAVLGGDARSGVPLRSFVDPAAVLAGEDHPENEPPDSDDSLLH